MRALALVIGLTASLQGQEAWSPLRPLADMPRRLDGGLTFPGPLTTPMPRIGLAWSAGNPAGLGLHDSVHHAEITAGRAGAHGTLRRPLEPARWTSVAIEARGVRQANGTGVLGGVRAAQFRNTSVAYNAMTEPYRSDPFVVADTVSADQRQVYSRLEGALGRGWGGWAVGLAVAVDLIDGHTVDAGFPRLGRRSRPAVAGGLARTLPLVGGRVALAARWQWEAETLRLPGLPRPGQAHIHAGYSEPEPISVVGPVGLLYHRVDRSATAWSAALDGGTGPIRWVAWHERGSRTDEHRHERQDQTLDIWRATGWSLGAAGAFLLGATFRGVATAELHAVSGRAVRSDLPDADFLRSRERDVRLRGEIRWSPANGAWQVALAGGATRARREVDDFLVPISTALVAWTGSGSAEVVRWIGPLGISLGFGAGSHAATGRLPDPAALGPLFARVTGPEVQTAARQARVAAARLGMAWRVANGTHAFVTGDLHRRTASGPVGTLTLAATGSRTTPSLAVGVTIGPTRR